MSKKQLVLATGNPGKVVEMQALLAAHLPVEIVSQAYYALPEAEETGSTFVENALIKARHAATLTQLPALADDSGLVVDVLQGAPGVYSARYAGDEATSQQNRAKLLAQLALYPLSTQRMAYFYCVLVYLRYPSDPTPIVCQGRWDGHILTAPQGELGFGYDELFYVPSHMCSAAELNVAEKNRISHRGQALQEMISLIKAF